MSRPAARLPRGFYARPALDVAPDLLGMVLVRRSPSGARVAARIVETEAYRPDDEASHSFRGPTARNATMFGPPGHLYVYFTYGMHHCANVVTGAGEGSAVLLRAAEPLEGLATMRRRRGVRSDLELCRGPAKLTQAFGITRKQDGADLIGDTIRIERGVSVPRRSIARGPRVGISSDRERPWRFWIEDDAYVSRVRRG